MMNIYFDTEFTEIWLDVLNYEGLYEVSNLGKIRNKKTNKILSPSKDKKNYLRVGLRKDKNTKTFLVHQLVAKAFIENTYNLKMIDHINCNPLDNKASNLRWTTYKENANNLITKERISISKSKENHPMFNKKHKQSTINKMIDSNKNKRKIKQLDKNFNLIKTYNSISEVCRLFNYKHGNIIKCCQKERKTAYGYIWEYAS